LIDKAALLLSGHSALAAESRRHAVEKCCEPPAQLPAP
jgi:hypothetical protein